MTPLDSEIDDILEGMDSTNWAFADVLAWMKEHADHFRGITYKKGMLRGQLLDLMSPEQLAFIRQAVDERAEAAGR